MAHAFEPQHRKSHSPLSALTTRRMSIPPPVAHPLLFSDRTDAAYCDEECSAVAQPMQRVASGDAPHCPWAGRIKERRGGSATWAFPTSSSFFYTLILLFPQTSDDDSALVIVFAESGGRTTLLLLEDTVEVADIVETTVITDVCHTVGGIYQLPGGMAQTYVDDVVGYRLAGLHTEVAAEGVSPA